MKNKDDIYVTYPFNFSSLDYPDNYSFCITVYFLGCAHNCIGCHNKQYKNYNKDLGNVKVFNYKEFELELLEALKRNRTNKCVLMGGDPLYKENIHITKQLISNNPDIEFTIYTGHNIDYVKSNKIDGFKFIKCGLYDEKLKQKSEKTNDYFILSSTNQALYNQDFKCVSNLGIYDLKKGE